MADEISSFLSGRDLTREFGFGRQRTIAVDHVDFNFKENEVVSIVGESGSGKTTLAKMLLGLIKPTDGEVYFQGKKRDISTRRKKKEYWKNIQAIFQDPFSSFNMFNKIDTVLSDCINMRGNGRISGREKTDIMEEACGFVNLKFSELTQKYPFELSGGQQQRLMIARIFILKPRILLADEPTSMIDACSRATILDMLMQLRDEIGMTIIFITHDIGLAYYVSDSVYIMEQGRFVEQGSADDIILNPKEPYTQRLINDVPKIHLDDPGAENYALVINEPQLRIPLQLWGIFYFFHSRIPTPDEISNCERIFITPDSPSWDPYSDHYISNKESMLEHEGNMIDHQYRKKNIVDMPPAISVSIAAFDSEIDRIIDIHNIYPEQQEDSQSMAQTDMLGIVSALNTHVQHTNLGISCGSTTASSGLGCNLFEPEQAETNALQEFKPSIISADFLSKI